MAKARKAAVETQVTSGGFKFSIFPGNEAWGGGFYGVVWAPLGTRALKLTIPEADALAVHVQGMVAGTGATAAESWGKNLAACADRARAAVEARS